VICLSSKSYLLEGLHSAEEKKQKNASKSYEMHPLLSEMEAAVVFVYFW